MSSPSADPLGVVIASGQVYAEVRQLSTAMTRMEGKIDAMSERSGRAEQDREDDLKARSEMNRRLTSVERKLWVATGAVGSVCTVIGWLSHYLSVSR